MRLLKRSLFCQIPVHDDLEMMHSNRQMRTRALPRSADPSPQRTASRIESLHRMSLERDRSSSPMFLSDQFFKNNPRLVAANDPREQQHLLPHQQLRSASPSNPAFKQNQVLYVCHGHCSGPECEFSQSIRQWQSMVMLGASKGGGEQCFQSEVVEKAPLSLMKLDEKRQSLSQMKEVLAGKLESKQRHKEKRRKEKKERSRSGSGRGSRQRQESPGQNGRGSRQRQEPPNVTVISPSNTGGRETPSNQEISQTSTVSEQGTTKELFSSQPDKLQGL